MYRRTSRTSYVVLQLAGELLNHRVTLPLAFRALLISQTQTLHLSLGRTGLLAGLTRIIPIPDFPLHLLQRGDPLLHAETSDGDSVVVLLKIGELASSHAL